MFSAGGAIERGRAGAAVRTAIYHDFAAAPTVLAVARWVARRHTLLDGRMPEVRGDAALDVNRQDGQEIMAHINVRVPGMTITCAALF